MLSELKLDLLGRHFSTENLQQLFTQKIMFGSATGSDGISARQFQDIADREISIVLRKVQNSDYHFTRYREKLLSKGRGAAPREIAIPSVRDKLVLRALNDYLVDIFGSNICYPIPINRSISRLKTAMASGAYSGYLRLDIKQFYSQIPLDILIDKVSQGLHEPKILHLIRSCVSQRTYHQTGLVTHGIPQGLPVSNTLANIYLRELDDRWLSDSSVVYTRFVDDVLLLGQLGSLPTIHTEICSMLKAVGLEVHALDSGKSALKPIEEPVNYLGYMLSPRKISVREASVHSLRHALIKIITSYANQRKPGYTKKLLWKLNLRITGCVVKNQRFGWLFFFSEINDKSLLKSLDLFVAKMLRRWKVRNLKHKKFTRTYFEIRHRARTLRYIPTFDLFSMAEKTTLLKQIYGIKITSKWSEQDIDKEFFYRIRKETESLEEDLLKFS